MRNTSRHPGGDARSADLYQVLAYALLPGCQARYLSTPPPMMLTKTRAPSTASWTAGAWSKWCWTCGARRLNYWTASRRWLPFASIGRGSIRGWPRLMPSSGASRAAGSDGGSWAELDVDVEVGDRERPVAHTEKPVDDLDPFATTEMGFACGPDSGTPDLSKEGADWRDIISALKAVLYPSRDLTCRPAVTADRAWAFVSQLDVGCRRAADSRSSVDAVGKPRQPLTDIGQAQGLPLPGSADSGGRGRMSEIRGSTGPSANSGPAGRERGPGATMTQVLASLGREAHVVQQSGAADARWISGQTRRESRRMNWRRCA